MVYKLKQKIYITRKKKKKKMQYMEEKKVYINIYVHINIYVGDDNDTLFINIHMCHLYENFSWCAHAYGEKDIYILGLYIFICSFIHSRVSLRLCIKTLFFYLISMQV